MPANMIDGRGAPGIHRNTVYASPGCSNELIERFVAMRVSCEGEGEEGKI